MLSISVNAGLTFKKLKWGPLGFVNIQPSSIYNRKHMFIYAIKIHNLYLLHCLRLNWTVLYFPLLLGLNIFYKLFTIACWTFGPFLLMNWCN